MVMVVCTAIGQDSGFGHGKQTYRARISSLLFGRCFVRVEIARGALQLLPDACSNFGRFLGDRVLGLGKWAGLPQDLAIRKSLPLAPGGAP